MQPALGGGRLAVAAGCQGGKNRREPRNDSVLATDHQAIAVFAAEHAAAGADVEMMQGALLERFRPPQVVAPERIAAVDHSIAGAEQLAEPFNGGFGRISRRQHDPDDPRRRQPFHQVFDALRRHSTVARQVLLGCRRLVVSHDAMAAAHQAAGDIARPSGQARSFRSAYRHPSRGYMTACPHEAHPGKFDIHAWWSAWRAGYTRIGIST